LILQKLALSRRSDTNASRITFSELHFCHPARHATRREISLPSPSANAAPQIATGEVLNAEALGLALRTALPPMRVHSLSIYNIEGDVQWLSEGALGPDEHRVVYEAIETLGASENLNLSTRTLDDGHSAIFLAIRAPHGELAGLVMILADPKSLKGEAPLQSITAQLRPILQKIAVLLRVKVGASVSGTSQLPRSPAAANAASIAVSELSLMPDSLPVLAAAPEPADPHPPPKRARGVPRYELSIEPHAPPATTTPATLPLPAALEDGDDLLLDVQQLTQLRSGGRTRRYEVLARSRRDAGRSQVPPAFVAPAARGPEGAALDGRVLKQLLSWLGENPVVWDAEPASFSINVSVGALANAQFLHGLPAELARTGVAAQCIGFEIGELACCQCPQEVGRFISACEQIGCFLVLDNFSLAAEAVPFLRSPALRLVKIDARLTSTAMQDKLSQALVVAIAQACKVLGIHCVAKRVESQAALQWLTGVGCDLAQGFALDRPLPLESLAAAAGCTKPASAARRKTR
jgi:EAL domain-containing protein (putative c-di-GMP-specific phosphodiesterase class I)